MLLILASPHVLSEPSGAGARPVHPIRVISARCGIWSISGITDMAHTCCWLNSVADDPDVGEPQLAGALTTDCVLP